MLQTTDKPMLYRLHLTYPDGYVHVYLTDILFVHGVRLTQHGGRPIKIEVFTREVPTQVELIELHRHLHPASNEGVVIHHITKRNN